MGLCCQSLRCQSLRIRVWRPINAASWFNLARTLSTVCVLRTTTLGHCQPDLCVIYPTTLQSRVGSVSSVAGDRGLLSVSAGFSCCVCWGSAEHATPRSNNISRSNPVEITNWIDWVLPSSIAKFKCASSHPTTSLHLTPKQSACRLSAAVPTCRVPRTYRSLFTPVSRELALLLVSFCEYTQAFHIHDRSHVVEATANMTLLQCC